MTLSAGPLLEARGISKAFGTVVALSDVGLDIRHGEVLALVGDNGAGKSTLIKIISGVMAADEGEIYIAGERVAIQSPIDAKRVGIETVYQNLALVDAFDSSQNIFLGRELHRRGPVGRLFLDHGAMRREARDHLDELQASVPSVRTKVRYLSGGQRQAVALSRAVGWGSRLIIMDEPTAALGVQEAAKVLRVVDSLRERGMSVMLISHNLQHVFDVADRVTVLRHGRNVGTRQTVGTDPDEIVRLITGADLVTAQRAALSRRSREGQTAAPAG